MPELPEMENYRILLSQRIIGKLITKVSVSREKSLNVSAEDFINRIQSEKIQSIERRAKYLLFYLTNGNVLLLHLMLGGWMFYGTERQKPERTVQVKLSFGDQHLFFIGLRLGYLHIFSHEAVNQELADLGPEPLDENFTNEDFLDLVKNRRGRIKTTLVNQKFLSGIGNRYSDEIAWHAQLLPERKMNELEDQESTQLFKSIRFVLELGAKNGGYMDQPLFEGDTKTGSYNDRTYVYNHEGQSCKRCGTLITKKEVSSRKTFYCKGCQT
ncbi:Fpg/Nei family DNA glycosylase [Virgibacillus sp. DJP39]|uniref:Fpg/Nei family DNA glycosylase n=1 Tax=Virgibacillus sp. DJP39 TaxID=3409790 RepID=UPI003BB6A984